MKIPIALQLYSVRNDAAKDLFGVLDRVAKMGYEGVEFAGFYGNGAAEIRQALDANGLRAEGTHTGLNLLEDDVFGQTVADHHTLGTEFLIVPWIPEELRNEPDACMATAARLTKLTERLAAEGLRLGFHCHAGDMKPLSGGKSAWDILGANTPPEFILQYDTANGMDGGADPVQPILDWPGRNASLHLKEYGGKHGAVIGEGDVPWQRVFDAAENGGGVQWYVVEYETESDLPPLDAVDQCLKNLRAMGK
jgi:sugar phosphate isomerase/epimerase